MKPIQPILILAIVLSVVFYLTRFRSSVRDRWLVSFFIGMTILSVLFPQLVQLIAEALGVGRGTDLVLYLLAASSILVWVLFYTELKRVQSNLTKLTRQMAIDNAKEGRRSKASDPGNG